MPEIEAKGASVITLSPQLADYSKPWMEEDGITFDVLSDLGNQVARDYGLVFKLSEDLQDVYLNFFKLDLPRMNGDQSWQLALPATFVIDRDGTIVYSEADPDYTVRPEPSDVVAMIPGS